MVPRYVKAPLKVGYAVVVKWIRLDQAIQYCVYRPSDSNPSLLPEWMARFNQVIANLHTKKPSIFRSNITEVNIGRNESTQKPHERKICNFELSCNC
jgi:hypothetical protein